MYGVDQRGKGRAIRARVLGAQSTQRSGLDQQAFAPTLDRVQARFLSVWRVIPLGQPRANRGSVDLTHQAPDELKLAPSGFVLRYPSRLADGVEQALRQVEVREPAWVYAYERFAKRLQLIHLGLATGFGRSLRLYRCRGCFVGSSHGLHSEKRVFVMIPGRPCSDRSRESVDDRYCSRCLARHALSSYS